jgi:hypothetical protein
MSLSSWNESVSNCLGPDIKAWGFDSSLWVCMLSIFLSDSSFSAHRDLGAGKTTFAKNYIRTLVEDPDLIVNSPSYVLKNTYELIDNSRFFPFFLLCHSNTIVSIISISIDSPRIMTSPC